MRTLSELPPVIAPVGIVRETALTAQLREKSLGAPRLGRASALAWRHEAASLVHQSEQSKDKLGSPIQALGDDAGIEP